MIIVTTFLRQSLAGLRVLLGLTLVLGLLYPLALVGIGALGVGAGREGSFVERGGVVVGSALLGQPADGDGWFHPRPSAAGDGYDPLASGASNLGPENTDLLALVEERRSAVAELEGVDPADVPPDALTASGSGLDPHISPAYAELQVARVARARGLDEAAVRALVAEHTAGRTLGFLGEPRVNVLELNLAVAAAGRTGTTG